ncbi:MAG: hypothetical protein WCV73_04965 [Patescibacteria group bacterium]|jgi:hypothetical protein
MQLFDKYGRRIPPQDLKSAVSNSVIEHPEYRNHFLFRSSVKSGWSQYKPYYQERLAHLLEVGFSVDILPDVVEDRVNSLLSTIKLDKKIKNLLKGVYLWFVIPQMDIADLGEATKKFIKVAAASYCRRDPSYRQSEIEPSNLAGQVEITLNSRYGQLIEKVSNGPVVGIYFPGSLQGYSENARQEQMESLPENCILSGPLEMAISSIMFPDVLEKSFSANFHCSAIRSKDPRYFSVKFWYFDDIFKFDFYGGDGNLTDLGSECGLTLLW